MARKQANGAVAAEAAPVEEHLEEDSGENKPVHVIRLRNIRAAIWKNETEFGPRYNVTCSRFFKDGDGWRTTQTLGRDDLLVAAEVYREAFVWICGVSQATDVPF